MRVNRLLISILQGHDRCIAHRTRRSRSADALFRMAVQGVSQIFGWRVFRQRRNSILSLPRQCVRTAAGHQTWAREHNSHAQHHVTLTTDAKAHSIVIAPKAEGNGSSTNGGELLLLALATCYCNDIYREAAKRVDQLQSSRPSCLTRLAKLHLI